MQVIGYTSTGFINIIDDDGNAVTVPDNLANSDRQKIAEWEQQGNIIPVYSPPKLPFQPLDRLTFWIAAAQIGVTKASVLTHVNSIADPINREEARIFVEEALRYRREDPRVALLASMEGITPTQLDSLWEWASNIHLI